MRITAKLSSILVEYVHPSTRRIKAMFDDNIILY